MVQTDSLFFFIISLGGNLTKQQQNEFERQARMKEIVRKNKEEGNQLEGVRMSKREMLIDQIFGKNVVSNHNTFDHTVVPV